MQVTANSKRIGPGMERKRKLSEAIKKNDQATRKKTALVHNQTWEALDLAILAKIFDLLPSHELFWNVSLVCRGWQLACWDKLFWNTHGCLDLTASTPFFCCGDDDKSPSIMPKKDHNHTCSNLMMHLLQTILFGTNDAYGNSLEEWRSSIKTIRIPSELWIYNGFIWSLSCPELLEEPAAKPSRPLVLPGVVSSWNLKRLLLESPLFGKPIFTHFVDVDDWKVFKYIITSTFKSSSVDLMGFYRSQSADVIERCRSISQDLKDMIEKLTKSGILPEVLTEVEHRFLYQGPKARKFCNEESLKLACQRDSRREIHEFWLAVEDLFSDDKKNFSYSWPTSRGKSVFLDHYYVLKAAQPGCSCFTPEILKGSAVREWHALLVREGLAKETVQQDTNTGQQSDPPQGDAKKQTQNQNSSPQVLNIRKNYFSYVKYQEIAKGRREFAKKLLKIQLSQEQTATYEEFCGFISFRQEDGIGQKSLKKAAEFLYMKECLKLLKLWGGGPYKYLKGL